MNDHPNKRTISALDKMMEEMQFLVDHPRMQQRRWVAKGKEWLPVLQHAREDLQRGAAPHDLVMESYQSLLSALENLGLTVEKRDDVSWGYRWHGGPLEGTFPSRAAAVEAALRERLG